MTMSLPALLLLISIVVVLFAAITLGVIEQTLVSLGPASIPDPAPENEITIQN